MKRLINRRKDNRPKCPSTIEDALLMQHIPKDFLIADVKSPDSQAGHIVLSTADQLMALADRLVWYIDATFYVSIY